MFSNSCLSAERLLYSFASTLSWSAKVVGLLSHSLLNVMSSLACFANPSTSFCLVEMRALAVSIRLLQSVTLFSALWSSRVVASCLALIESASLRSVLIAFSSFSPLEISVSSFAIFSAASFSNASRTESADEVSAMSIPSAVHASWAWRVALATVVSLFNDFNSSSYIADSALISASILFFFPSSCLYWSSASSAAFFMPLMSAAKSSSMGISISIFWRHMGQVSPMCSLARRSMANFSRVSRCLSYSAFFRSLSSNAFCRGVANESASPLILLRLLSWEASFWRRLSMSAITLSRLLRCNFAVFILLTFSLSLSRVALARGMLSDSRDFSWTAIVSSFSFRASAISFNWFCASVRVGMSVVLRLLFSIDNTRLFSSIIVRPLQIAIRRLVIFWIFS